ncbi:hypothetical protein ASPFODRAFT_211051 [Aspergillus luchuensis CBS 106.47]|uniref:Uncharacterized protein n=1 Tax=Aspergillus luchuensis (strain CBS 106.47) TaxID=1137211 RepID=A0A1M3T6G5_ASPLC|nr:hypothetical protein ASPFODRAFT_211051 [Aspergillus luchuensis CBS 106.47]
MRLSSLFLLPTLLATTAICAPEPIPNVNLNDNNLVALAQALEPSLPTQTQPPPNLESVSPPPHAVVHQVITAVPPTALAQLFVPAKRVAMASEFSAGNTPEWYKALPTDVQSYFAEVKRQIAATGVGEVKAAEETKSSGGSVSAEVSGWLVGLVGAVAVVGGVVV